MMRRLVLLAAILAGACASAPPAADSLARGVALRNEGHIRLSIDALTAARNEAADPRARAMAAGELGASLLAAHRLPEARAELESALATLEGAASFPYRIDLGNVALAEKKPEEARRHFEQARQAAGDDPVARATALVQLARLGEAPARADMLRAASAELDRANTVPGRLHLNLGARALDLGSHAVELAERHLAAARAAALAQGDVALLLEADDALSQRHEEAERRDEAMRLVEEALAKSAGARPGIAGLARVQLLWRRGRLAARMERPELALASYLAAVDEVEALRPDIPIEYEDGQSSFRKTLAPVYLGLADLLLKQPAAPGETQRTLQRVRSVVELLKQTELQDYLGDRCVVAAENAAGVGAGTAILYPIVFADRLEILLETSRGLARFTTAVSARTLTRVANEMASKFRAAPRGGIEAAREIYDWIVRPLEPALAAESISMLVVVPDGVLRLVPFAALHDGKRYLVERVALATVPGLSMTNAPPAHERSSLALIAGLSEPGPVVERLPKGFAESLLGEQATRSPTKIREALSLPGVKREVEGVSKMIRNDTLMDSQFTAARFERQFGAGRYGIVHIASHGVFGGSASDSFIMTYDELLTMDRLQALIGQSAGREAAIDLLTLSACETAEGDDRSPLGISGAALKAHAASAVGTLWPVEDTAAERVMQEFYSNLRDPRVGKAEAMRRAQEKLMNDPQFAHPFFWAPFIVVGSWQ